MTASMATGCVLLGFGIPLILFATIVGRKSQLLIVFISAAFCWLLSLMLSAFVWLIPPREAWVPYALVTFSVLAQEGARLGYFHWYSKFENSFSVVSTNAVAFPLIDFYSALSAGMGFGVMSTTLLYGTVLSHSSGPGTVFAETCTHFSMYIIAACNAFAFNLLHIFSMIIAFEGYRKKSTYLVILVAVVNFLANQATTLNSKHDGCLTSIPALFAVTAFTGVALWFVVNHNQYSSKRVD